MCIFVRISKTVKQRECQKMIRDSNSQGGRRSETQTDRKGGRERRREGVCERKSNVQQTFPAVSLSSQTEISAVVGTLGASPSNMLQHLALVKR